jgi:hypothetical protein
VSGARSPLLALAPEWRRIELLAELLLAGRRGEELRADTLDAVAELREPIARLRGAGAWRPLVGGELTDLELDVLAAVLTPLVSPRVAASVAGLQPDLPHGLVTSGVIHDLFGLDSADVPEMHAALSPTGALGRRRLLLLPGDLTDWREPVRPAPVLVEALLGTGAGQAAPPGAMRVDTPLGLDHLVIEPATAAQLDELVATARHRHAIAGWGGIPSGGPVALFAGPSGVGKSAAAGAVARELGWPLFRVDLGALVSKYIGETEKNLTRLLDAAHGRRLVLHFEEAESLFGRRGEIREARDRYANLEVSHLLARIEAHDGPCILSSNLRRNLDPAFIRRFQVVVEFPRPDTPLRADLWRALLPPRAPLADDVDPELLATIDLSGAEIRNAAHYACVLAAAGRGAPDEVTLGLLALGVWRELGKDGRQLALTDLGPLAPHLPDDVRRAKEEA